MFSPPLFRFDLKKFLLCGILGFLLVPGLGTPSSAMAQGRSARSALNRMRAVQAAQKKQTVSALQAELAAAQSALSQAESQLATTGPALQSAKSQLDTAKEREAAKEKETHEAAKKHRALEEQLLAAQAPETPVGKARAQLEQAQLELDRVVHQVLSLPDHPAGVTEADRSNERLKLTEAQKTRLKADTGYLQATEKMAAMKAQLHEAEQQLLTNDASWKESHAERQALTQDLKALEENRKAAAAEVAVNLKQFKAAQQVAANAQNVVTASSNQLKALGAQPQASAAKK